MKKIYKFRLDIQKEKQILKIKGCIEILSVESQEMDIVVYALVDDSVSYNKKYEFYVVGTGHDANHISDKLFPYTFKGTVKMMDGALMWHVFYKSEK